jgi:F-type H+-transporting ATPase subunit epsilon
MAAFQFELVTPEKLVFSGEVEAVTIPGMEGEFTVFKDHAPVISSMRPGILVINQTAAANQRIYVPGGFAEAAPSGLTILANQALPLEELNAAKLNADIETFEDEANAAKTAEEKRAAEEKRDHVIQLKATLKL